MVFKIRSRNKSYRISPIYFNVELLVKNVLCFGWKKKKRNKQWNVACVRLFFFSLFCGVGKTMIRFDMWICMYFVVCAHLIRIVLQKTQQTSNIKFVQTKYLWYIRVEMVFCAKSINRKAIGFFFHCSFVSFTWSWRNMTHVLLSSLL